MQWRHGCLEFYGGLVSWALARTPISAAAMTLGHTILGRDALALELARAHEHVHVRQYALWGPLFLPAYLGCAAVLWLGGRHPYWDNPFEREAYRLVPGPQPPVVRGAKENVDFRSAKNSSADQLTTAAQLRPAQPRAGGSVPLSEGDR